MKVIVIGITGQDEIRYGNYLVNCFRYRELVDLNSDHINFVHDYSTMSTSYHMIDPIATLHDYAQPVTALSFDPVSDTLWSGTSVGTVVALHTIQGLRAVSFPVGGALPVKQIVAGDNYVRALGAAGEGIGSWAKGGMNKWFFRYVIFQYYAVYPFMKAADQPLLLQRSRTIRILPMSLQHQQLHLSLSS